MLSKLHVIIFFAKNLLFSFLNRMVTFSFLQPTNLVMSVLWILCKFSFMIIIRVSAQGQVLHWKLRNQDRSSAQGRSSIANSGTQAALLLGMDRCGSFQLLSAPHSLFSMWTDLKTEVTKNDSRRTMYHYATRNVTPQFPLALRNASQNGTFRRARGNWGVTLRVA